MDRRKYLNNKLEDLNYQILSLEQELGYADHIAENEEIIMLQEYKKTIADRNDLRRVIDRLP